MVGWEPSTERAPAGATMPRYPIYVPSKGRPEPHLATAARWLAHDRVPFRLVVEPTEAERYEELVAGLDHDGAELLVLPFHDLGQGSIPARNWIRDHAEAEGHARHWQLDDNTFGFYRFWKGKRLPCRGGLALRVCEDFTDRYENVALSGLSYDIFGVRLLRPFVANVHVYSCTLVNHAAPHRWRGRYNEDADLCLQVLADGWCTLLVQAFMVKKRMTMKTRGGNTDELYADDGRLRMARSLERAWPGVVETKRRFQRPQHVVRNAWKHFDTPLRPRPREEWPPVDYPIELTQVAPEVSSPRLRRMVEEWRSSS